MGDPGQYMGKEFPCNEHMVIFGWESIVEAENISPFCLNAHSKMCWIMTSEALDT